MSRVGKKAIEVPKDVKVTITGSTVEVQGPKGSLMTSIPEGISFKLEDGVLTAERASEEKAALHGLARALVANAVTGVTKGFTQEMDIVGVGYKAELRGRSVLFSRTPNRRIWKWAGKFWPGTIWRTCPELGSNGFESTWIRSLRT